MSNPIELFYPIYLDIPMIVSFVATMEGGYALEKVLKHNTNASGELTGQISGEAGIPDILSSLVKASLKASGNLDGKLGSAEESQIVFKHTEASLFMRLRHELRRQGRIISLDDCEQKHWDQILPSSLVEISGEVYRSPANEMIQMVKRLLPFILQSLPRDQDGNVDQSKIPSGQLSSILAMQVLCSDLEASPISDMLLKNEEKWSKNAVLNLSTKVLPIEGQESLRCGRVVVIGKATHVLSKNESINLYRRSILGYFAEEMIEQLESALKLQKEISITLPSPQVRYPAIEIVPMAIYV